MFDAEPIRPLRPLVHPPRRWPQFLALGLAVILMGTLVALYAGPSILVRWRNAEAQAEADAVYLKRQAELKAEAEAADQRLAALDSKVKLISLGFRQVARKVAPSVVNVSNERAVSRQRAQLLPPRSLFYDYNKDHFYVERGVGSGILVKPGLVLTNNHVVRGAERLRVTFANGDWVAVTVDPRREDFDPKAVAVDPLTDLAVIRLPPGKIKGAFQVTATFADSDKDVQVGDWALAMGSPLGLEQTMTAGIISAKGRVLSTLDQVEVLQTDAAINPGNSGGPLFDQHGRVIGINVAIASKTGGNQGIGFAIPSNTARDIFQQLVEHGEVVRGYLGVALQEMSISQIEKIRLGETGGVVVTQVQPDQPAARAGLAPGDIIVRFEDTKLGLANPLKQLRKLILNCQPGRTVKLEVVRREVHLVKTITIGKRPPLP